MKPIVIALKELKLALTQIHMSETILDTLVIFAASYLVCLLFIIPRGFAVAVGLLFFIYSISHRVARIKTREVEEKVPILTDQLATVADNLYRENEIINSLQKDVLNLMKHIRISYFIDFKRIWREIMILSILSFAILIVAAMNVQLVDYKVVAKEIGHLVSDEGIGSGFGIGEGGGGEDNFTDIFGNETLAELGSTELDLQINPVLSEINIDDIKEAEEREFEESLFPTDITASTDSSFDENIPKEHKEIVKKYFDKIAQER